MASTHYRDGQAATSRPVGPSAIDKREAAEQMAKEGDALEAAHQATLKRLDTDLTLGSQAVRDLQRRDQAAELPHQTAARLLRQAAAELQSINPIVSGKLVHMASQLMRETQNAPLTQAPQDDVVERTSGAVDLMPGNLNPSQEDARAAMFEMLGDTFNDLAQEESFLGFQIDVCKFSGVEGRVAYINLVPVDMISGVPARRIDNPA